MDGRGKKADEMEILDSDEAAEDEEIIKKNSSRFPQKLD